VTSQPAAVVLVVSDDPRVGPALVSYLSSDSSAMTTHGPISYRVLAALCDADVIVCDLDETDLATALESLAMLAQERATPVVALSANPTIRRRALERGAACAEDKSADVDRIAHHVAAAARRGDTP
jgi:DNA-binding NarL/FixJ family response regulator